MTDQEIRTAQEGLVPAFRSDPNSAYGTARVEASINDGIELAMLLMEQTSRRLIYLSDDKEHA